MKKIILQICVVFIALILSFASTKADNPAISTVDTNNVLLEYCTGTWCGYCPCGHQIINDNIMPAFPKTIVVGYHGTSSDPWYAYSQPMLSAFGLSSYPTGIIGRTTGIVSRSSWYSYVSTQSAQQPGVTMNITNKLYNEASRLISATANFTATQDLQAGDYRMMVIVTESNLVYPQNFYAACGTAGYHNDYVHAHVVKHVVNAPYGDSLTSNAWNTGVTISKQISFTLPSHIIYNNADFVVFVYKNGSPLSSNAAVQNAEDAPVASFTLTGVEKSNEIVNDYYLGQNYPNPFNPMTNIRFNVIKDGFTTLKVYDISGKEVVTYLNQFIKAGQYNVDFNGANLSSGVYFYNLTSGDYSDTKKMILVK
ncbi:MAG: Omp28-related outer membrane protein [Ignavibacteria bacterium]|jgi:hypothetical protein